MESKNGRKTGDLTENKENLCSGYYFERIKEFKALPVEARVEVYRKIHPIYCACYGWAEFQPMTQYYEQLPGDLVVLLLKTKAEEASAGFVVCSTDSVYFRPEDLRKENQFKVSYHSICLHPSHRGQKLGNHLFYAIQLTLKELYQGQNRSTRFVFPGPSEVLSQSVGDFFFAIKSNYLVEGITEISDYLVQYQLSILGFDKDRYLQEHPELDPISQYFADSFGFRPGLFLLGLFVHEMIEENSFQLEPRVYEQLPCISYEFVDKELI